MTRMQPDSLHVHDIFADVKHHHFPIENVFKAVYLQLSLAGSARVCSPSPAHAEAINAQLQLVEGDQIHRRVDLVPFYQL